MSDDIVAALLTMAFLNQLPNKNQEQILASFVDMRAGLRKINDDEKVIVAEGQVSTDHGRGPNVAAHPSDRRTPQDDDYNPILSNY